MSSPHEIEWYILQLIGKEKRVLDVGVGLGKNGYMIKVLNTPNYFVGIDVFLPNLALVKHHHIYDDVVLHNAVHLPFREKTFDVVLMSEVIEHLEKHDGLVLLEEVERVASEKIIIATPNKPVFRGGHRDGLQTPVGFNPYEEHKSSWNVKDFSSRGYRVFGLGILLRRYFGKYGHYLNRVFAYTTALTPGIADELIAIKEINR